MLIKNLIYDIVNDSIKKAVEDKKLPEKQLPEIKIEYPKDEKFGDYSTPIALESAKVIKKSPLETGNILKEYIELHDEISSVDVVKPGFINMYLSDSFIEKCINEVIETKNSYGQTKRKSVENINLEFVSANPTGPLNIVSARAAAIGDSLSRIIKATGHNVSKEFYINDYGNQVRLLGLSVLKRYRELLGEEIEFPEDGYQGEYVITIAEFMKENFSDEIDKLKDKDKIEYFASKAIEYNVNSQKEAMSKFNVEYDRWFSEKTLHENKKVEKALEDLNNKNVTYEEESKQFFKSTDFGDDKDRVIVRDDGRPTYLLADIAYHLDKYARGFDKIYDIWGPDHHGYIARLSGAMQALDHEKDSFKVLIAQQVNLLMEGELVKMSKRLGNFSTMQELIDEIGVDVARYFFTMRSMESHLDFDVELAKKTSSENPVFYLQYAHARICSIFRESNERKYNFDEKKFDIKLVDYPDVKSLLKFLIKFPDEIRDSADQLEVHHIPNYLLKVAQSFHKLYTEHRILSDDFDKANSLLVICECVKTVIKNGLYLVGVSAPERM